VILQHRARSADTERVKRAHATLVLSIYLLSTVVAWAQTTEEFPDSRSVSEWQHFDPDEYGEEWLKLDRNEDGLVDYAVMVDERGRKVREAMDFNYDGKMDDFYFYRNGVLLRQEIDTNFDRQIDAWIYLRRGVYIEMWERDRDFDGVIDDREQYGDSQ